MKQATTSGPRRDSVDIKQVVVTEVSTPEPAPQVSAEEILSESEPLKERIKQLGSDKILSTLEKAALERSLKPYQAELILMQKYLEATKRRMIALHERKALPCRRPR
jgi:hypothetical protein